MDPSYNNTFNSSNLGSDSGGTGDIVLAGEKKKRKPLMWVVAIVLLLVVVGIGFLIYYFVNRTDSYGGKFYDLMTVYDEVVGEKLQVLRQNNLTTDNIYILSDDDISKVDNALASLDAAKVGLSMPSDKYEQSQKVVEIIRNNITFLKKMNEAFLPQTQLSDEELAATCGGGEAIENLMNEYDEEVVSLLGGYNVNLCIYLNAGNERKDSALLGLKVSKLSIVKSLGSIESGLKLAEDILDGGK